MTNRITSWSRTGRNLNNSYRRLKNSEPRPLQATPFNYIHFNRLEEEGTSNQKLMQEKVSAENKIKTLEEQITINDDNISKVSHFINNY